MMLIGIAGVVRDGKRDLRLSLSPVGCVGVGLRWATIVAWGTGGSWISQTPG